MEKINIKNFLIFPPQLSGDKRIILFLAAMAECASLFGFSHPPIVKEDK
jgi:hypothetical protein